MQRVAEFLKRDFGLSSEPASEAILRAAVRDRMQVRVIESLDQYLRCLASDQDELLALVEYVLVPETWFFRNPEALAALAHLLRTEWRPTHHEETLRVLSVPCSTGEEAYSIAIALAEMGFHREEVRIDAMDVSPRALAKAARGVYGRNSFRGAESSVPSRYWHNTPDGIAVDAQIQRWVIFTRGNLADAGFSTPATTYHVIFCRNVLIYFDRAMQEKVVHDLKDRLAPDGLLFVGPAEALLAMECGFASAGYPMAFAFRKVAAARVKAQTPPLSALATVPSVAALREIARYGGAKTVPPIGRPEMPTVAATRSRTARPVLPVDALDSARVLADAGRLTEAATLCERQVEAQPTSAPSWYLLGLIHDALGDVPRASECYRKATFLDPSHVDALVHLGMLRRRGGVSARPRRR